MLKPNVQKALHEALNPVNMGRAVRSYIFCKHSFEKQYLIILGHTKRIYNPEIGHWNKSLVIFKNKKML